MRLLYLYPGPRSEGINRVLAGETPSDGMYGLVELRQRGHVVDVADSRFNGWFGRVVKALRPYSINLCDAQTLRRLADYDAVIVKDEFSPMLTLGCRSAGTRIVYLDSLFRLSSNPLKRRFLRWNIVNADAVVTYSQTQIALWASTLNVPQESMTFLPYTIDLPFYRLPVRHDPPARPYVLSVGRDTGRSFETLVQAMEGLGLELKLVTLPYLLKRVDITRPWIEVVEHLPYPDLLRLYAGAAFVVIPLKSGTTHASGIRGLFEALALGRAVIATRSLVLEEYVPEGQGVTYVSSNDPVALRTKIAELANDKDARDHMAHAGQQLITSSFGMTRFIDPFEQLIRELL